MSMDDDVLRRPEPGVSVRRVTWSLVAGVIGVTALAFPVDATAPTPARTENRAADTGSTSERATATATTGAESADAGRTGTRSD